MMSFPRPGNFGNKSSIKSKTKTNQTNEQKSEVSDGHRSANSPSYFTGIITVMTMTLLVYCSGDLHIISSHLPSSLLRKKY